MGLFCAFLKMISSCARFERATYQDAVGISSGFDPAQWRSSLNGLCLSHIEKEVMRGTFGMAVLSSYRAIYAGDPEIPPATPPEAPPEQPTEVPGEPVPESEPGSPPEAPPYAPPEVPQEIPPETRAGAVSQGAIL